MESAALGDARAHLAGLVAEALRAVAPADAPAAIVLERPKRAGHGDYACSVALQIAKALKRPPRELAEKIVAALAPSPRLERAEIAGAGFINLFLKPAYKQQAVNRVLQSGEAYGRLELGRGKRVQVEFVSANPTGPLHVGHGRGAAYGASLSNLLAAAGFDVTREYYVNDAGRQMDILALSTWLRYLEACGLAVSFPPNGYQGEYVRAMARTLRDRHQDRFKRPAPAASGNDDETRLDSLIAAAKSVLGADYGLVQGFALEQQLADCREDLAEFGVAFDKWYSERSLYESGRVERAVGRLRR